MRWMVYVQVSRGVGWFMCRSVEALDGLCAGQSVFSSAKKPLNYLHSVLV